MTYPSNSVLPQVAYGEGPEVVRSDPPQSKLGHEHVPSYLKPAKSPTILGLRHPTFWLLLILIAVVIIAAVGGGVGGSLAVKNAKSVSSNL